MKSFRLLLSVMVMTLWCAAISPAHAQTETILHNFDDGSVPNDGDTSGFLIQGTDGNFYGTCQAGGQPLDMGESVGAGVVYKVTPSGTYTILHRFAPVDPSNPLGPNSDGVEAETLAEGNDGNFYGITNVGGTTDFGVAFKITPDGTFTLLHTFADGTVSNDGVRPNFLVAGTDGNFYGTTLDGGTTAPPNDQGSDLGSGTAFKMSPTGVVTILHNFGDGSVADDGLAPVNFFLGSDGNFYGTTEAGGTAQEGTIFRMTPSGIVTTLHNIGDGSFPNTGIVESLISFIQGSDGNFYGTSATGGSTVSTDPHHVGYGYVFKMTPSGTVTTLHNFSDGSIPNDGAVPTNLIQGSDGKLYGLTSEGGATATDPNYGHGTVFQITPSGVITIIHNFEDGTVANDGRFGMALTAGTDGNIYGTTLYGGSTTPADPNHIGAGTIFQLTPAVKIWKVIGTAAAPDGTARLLWTRTDGAAGLWSMSQSDIQAAVGAVYGPYPGWSAKDVAVAGDGTTRVLWTNANGRAGLWSFDAAGVATTVGPAYGPYTGWKATDLATAPDGTSRLLWIRADGAAGVWTMDASGRQILIGSVYGPYTGWTAKAIGAAADGTSRILWSRDDGAAGLWSLRTDDTLRSIGAAYGPFSDSHGTWSAADIGTSSDGTTQVLWNRSDGATGVWTFTDGDVAAMIGPVYGPYVGYTATALTSANDQARVLWVRADRAAGLWTIGGNNAMSTIGVVYGPF